MLNVEYLVTRPATQNYTPTFLSTLSRYTIPSNHISDKNCNPIRTDFGIYRKIEMYMEL